MPSVARRGRVTAHAPRRPAIPSSPPEDRGQGGGMRRPRAAHGPTTAAPARRPVAFDPAEAELGTGTHTFRFEPLDPPHRALVEAADGINGHPLDWALASDAWLEDTLVAVRQRPDAVGLPAWFAHDRRLREETFHSPLSGRAWSPETGLVRRLLAHTPYVIVRPLDGQVQYAFDVRTVAEPRDVARILQTVGPDTVLPATGVPGTEAGEMQVLATSVPFRGDRVARSTRKAFRLAAPGGGHELTVEGVAARILQTRGYLVEAPRLFVAMYRILIGEVIAYWWRDAEDAELRGAQRHHPPGANPIEATRRGLHAVGEVESGGAPDAIRAFGDLLVKTGKRPATYTRYTERLAQFAEAMRGPALAGCLEGTLRGHRATSADLVAAHQATQQAFLVEVKSKGDRLRSSQYGSALWHERDGRCGYRLMKVDHPDA